MEFKKVTWDEMIPGKIYLTKKFNRIVKVDDDWVYVLTTQHFLKFSEKDKQHEFYEYPYGYPKAHLLDDEFVYGKEAVLKQIESGEAEKEVILKKPDAILRKVKKAFKFYLTDYKEQLKRL